MKMHATTILCVKRKDSIALGGDGQVTLGDTVVKGNACKIRRLYDDQVITGFAGSVADAFTLYDRFEQKLEEFNGDLIRAAVELASMWRLDKYLRQLEAMLLAADRKQMLIISGDGNVIEPEHSVMAIGSGGDFAKSAALALVDNTKLRAAEIVRKSLEIAGKTCIYTNTNITIEELSTKK